MSQQRNVSLSRDLQGDLRELASVYPTDKIFLLFETHTWQHCREAVLGFRDIPADHILVLEAGEEEKRIEQVMRVWELLGSRGIDRKSLIINVGGGMLTDLGGFAASTLKRGIAFINLPTTLLAMVDASVGGKTGINFRGLKNEVGTIRQPLHVLIWIPFLRTLDQENLLSGYAELLKAGLIADAGLWKSLKDLDVGRCDEKTLGGLIWRAVEIKQTIVESDPEEQGIRKALNFGHTIGHALESEALRQNRLVPHGFAVAWGMIIEARLSQQILNLPETSVQEIRQSIQKLFGSPPPGITHHDPLLHWMRFDKKNSGNQINFTLLEKIGQYRVNCTVSEEEIRKVMSDE